MKTIAIVGSTGSIGTSALKVLKKIKKNLSLYFYLLTKITKNF